MKRRMSEAAKERWRKRKASMEVSQNEGDENIQRVSLASQNEMAEGPSYSALTTDNEQSKHSQSAAFASKRKVSEVNNMIVRRSNRIKSSFGKRKGRKAVQHIDLTDCDRDKELHVEPIRGVVHTQADVPTNSGLTNTQSKLSQAFSSKRRKTLKTNDMIVRQSGHLKSLGSTGKRQGRKGVRHVSPTNCDRDTELHVERISPGPIRNKSSSEMRRRLSEAAKERWRKRKASMEASQNEGDHNIQRESLAYQNEVAEGPSHSALTTDNEPSKHSQSAAFTSKRKVSKVNNMIVRRSNRIKSLGSFGKRHGRKAVQHIGLTDCDRDKELHVDPIVLKPIRGVVHAQADGAKNSAVTNSQSKLPQAVSSKRKTLMANNMIVRQSGLLKSLESIEKRQRRKGVHHVDPTDCELHVEPISPEPIRNMSRSELIVDHLVQTRGKRPFASETTPTNLNYKTLYTASAKKSEALTEENHQQAQKLYYMLGKVKIYENMIGSVMNLCRGAVKLHPDAAALISAPAQKSSPVKKKKDSVKRMRKN